MNFSCLKLDLKRNRKCNKSPPNNHIFATNASSMHSDNGKELLEISEIKCIQCTPSL